MAAARAVPKQQEDCIEPTLSSDNNVDMAPAATSTAAPEPTVEAELSATAGVVVVTTLVHETQNGVVFVPYPLDPVPTAIQTVSATTDQAPLTSTLPSHGGIFFDPVSTPSVFVIDTVVVSTAIQTVSADCDEAPLTSSSPSLGDIFFDPVSTSSVSVNVPVVVPTAMQTVSTDSEEAPVTSTSPSLGGIFFDPGTWSINRPHKGHSDCFLSQCQFVAKCRCSSGHHFPSCSRHGLCDGYL